MPECAVCGKMIRRGEISGMWVHVNPHDAQGHPSQPGWDQWDFEWELVRELEHE